MHTFIQTQIISLHFIHRFKQLQQNSTLNKAMRNFQSPQSPQPLPQHFFNDSFYNEKIISTQNQSDTTYMSYQYIKKYFQATHINQLINKAVRTTLQSSYLPENPYNMIGRLLLHDCIFQNIRAYYAMGGGTVGKKGVGGQRSSSGGGGMKVNSMVEIKIGGVGYGVGWKLAGLVRPQRVNALWPLVFQQKQQKKKSKKSKISQISHCLSGTSILHQGSPYSSQQPITPTLLITTTPTPQNDHISQFADYVINDCLSICESANNIFIKLYLYTYKAESTQWSFQNLLHNRVKIHKEICKMCVIGFEEIRCQYLVKSTPEVLKYMSTSYIRVTRSYILIEQDLKQCQIHSLKPSQILLTSVFEPQCHQVYYHQVQKSYPNKNTIQQLLHKYHQQIHKNIIYSLSKQQPSWIGWCLFFSNLYESVEGNTSVDKEVRNSVYVMMDSPLGFVSGLCHEIGIAKIMSARSASISYEKEIYVILQKIQSLIKSYIQKEEHIYPETVLFFQAVNHNLQLILQSPSSSRPTTTIKPILQRIQLLFKYLLNSFYQICFVLKGHLLNQIVKIDNVYGKDGSGQIISNCITYDIFLRKYKDLPERVLKVDQEVQKFRRVFERSDQEVRQLILAKYVQKYKLYEQVYGFYWDTICGKKLAYPMGKFVTMLRNQAIRFDSTRYTNNNKDKSKKNMHLDIEQTKTDGIMIYQKAADARGQHLFYSLTQPPLQDKNIQPYTTIKTLFTQFFQNDLISQKSINSLSHLQKNSYILSISTQINRLINQQSDFTKCKIYVDSIYHVPIDVGSLYTVMYEQIVEKLRMLEENGFGVIGVYNGDKGFLDQDQVYAWTQCQQKYDLYFIRYQAKKNINKESLSKLIKTCKNSNNQILIRGVFWVNGLLKSCQISFNFLINKEWLINLSHTYKNRIFSKHEDVARWCNYNGLKEYITSQKSIQDNPKYDAREQVKKKYLSNHIDLIQFIAQDIQQPLQISRIRNYSPFYLQLEHVLSIIQGIFFMLEYVKTDRQSKFHIRELKDTIDILEYYLFDKCLRKDRYIYSEGLSVTIINMVATINKYIGQHQDNNGEEKELIYLQKVLIRLMNSIHYVLTSCAFGIIEAIQNQYIQEDSDDDD